VGYLDYYEAVLPKLSPRGLIAFDNTLSHGQVLDETDRSPRAETIRAFNERARNDPRVRCVILNVRDGITLIRRA